MLEQTGYKGMSPLSWRRDGATEGLAHLYAVRSWLRGSVTPPYVLSFTLTANWHFLAIFACGVC